MKGVVPQKSQNVNKKLGRTSTFWRWVGEQYPDFVKDEIFKGNKSPLPLRGIKKKNVLLSLWMKLLRYLPLILIYSPQFK
jgi:hypothetical protein